MSTVKTKKIPMRMCIVCREMKPKKEMLRIVKNSEGKIFLDFKGKAPGRGAYICDNIECINKCGKNKVLNKVFSCEIPAEIYQVIKEDFLAKK